MPVNMSYCRFEHTLAALRECKEALDEMDELNGLSKSEMDAAAQLFQLCWKIAGDSISKIDRTTQ